MLIKTRGKGKTKSVKALEMNVMKLTLYEIFILETIGWKYFGNLK